MITPVTDPMRFAQAEIVGGMAPEAAFCKYGLLVPHTPVTPDSSWRRRVYSPQDRDERASRLRGGWADEQLREARIAGIRRAAARKLLLDMGLPLYKATVDRAVELYAEGKTGTQVYRILMMERRRA